MKSDMNTSMNSCPLKYQPESSGHPVRCYYKYPTGTNDYPSLGSSQMSIVSV